MAKEIDKIIQSKTAPKSNNILWDDGENLKINRNGKWENANNAEINNLSTDPVVWKYMCDPYEILLSNITSGTAEIPEDLAEVISKNLNYARLTVSLCISGEVYFANGIGDSQYLMFYTPDFNTIYVGFNGKNVFTP